MFADEGSGTGNQVLWYLSDQQNTVRDVAKYASTTAGSQATVRNHLEYDAYGNVTSVDDPTTGTANDGDLPGLEGVGNEYSPQRSYTGREPDPATGLIYYRARWFDPRLGRFISNDPIDFAAGDANLSRYVGNSTLNAVDPSGLIDPTFQLPWRGIPSHIQQQQNRVDNYAGINGVARAAVNTVTLGGISDFEAVTPPPDVRNSWSYNRTVAAHRCVIEFAMGFGAGTAASAPGRTGRIFFGFDTAQNLSNTGQGLYNGDPWQTGFGLLGFSGNLAGLSSFRNADEFGNASSENATQQIVFGAYGVLRHGTDIPGQAHHLNQDAAFRSRIPRCEGVSAKLEGNAFTDVGTPHYNAHESMESFWDIYRRGGMAAGNLPTNSQYNRALYNGLQESGLSAAEALRAVQAAKAQQLSAGLRGSDLVPKLPGRLNQVARDY